MQDRPAAVDTLAGNRLLDEAFRVLS